MGRCILVFLPRPCSLLCSFLLSRSLIFYPASEKTSTKAAEAANAPSSSSPSMQEFTREEVAKHNKKDDI